MPETRGRTSAMRVGAMRPGNSLVIGMGSAFTAMKLTGEGGGAGAFSAELCDSLQAAANRGRSKAKAIRVAFMGWFP